MNIDFDSLPSPCYVIDEVVVSRNLEILDRVRQRTGVRILLALKAFACPALFPRMRGVLDGVCASSVHEARLGREEFGGHVAVFAPGWHDHEIAEICRLADSVCFNSFSQWERFGPLIRAAERPIACGLRINPEHSEVRTPLYDPCAPGSRLGIRAAEFAGRSLDGITGIHFHTLCELGADALERTLDVVERRFGHILERMEWINMGGGHHITRADYDVDLLCRLIDRVRERYHVEVYLEPGEAVVLNAGYLAATVLDIVQADMPVAVLDTSAAAHMPDVLEMPYTPEVLGAGPPGARRYTFRLAGRTCLAGDVIGEYSFDRRLRRGDRVVFLDMAHYTMVKNNTFNGIQLPAIAVANSATGTVRIVKEFGYEDFRSRLG